MSMAVINNIANNINLRPIFSIKEKIVALVPPTNEKTQYF